MSSRRTAKVAEAIRETVSTTILFHLKDPRVQNVTVIGAEVSADLRNAKVFVSVMGDEKTQALTLHGLDSARGFIQSKVGDRLQIKHTPILKFVLDRGVKMSAETSAILRETMVESETVESETAESEPKTEAESVGPEDPAGEASGEEDHQP